MATAARVTIAEVEHLVDPGAIDPDHVVTPGIFVRYIVKGEKYEKRIEKRTVSAALPAAAAAEEASQAIARAAQKAGV